MSNTYEFTAFSEADLVDGNLNCGDTFVMPADATVCISVEDDDRYLSGDSWCNENSNDRYGQTAQIEGSSGELGNGGQIYAEVYHWVHDQDGNWYLMIEIEQEGSGEDYFTFHSAYGVPPAGAELTVYSTCNVTSDWIDYDCLGAGEKASEPEPGCIYGRLTLDADCNNNEWNEETGAWDAGIEGQTVQLLDLDGNVVAETTTDGYGNYSFMIEPGQYQVKFPSLDGHEYAEKGVGGWHYNSDANADGVTDVITVESGADVSNIDASLKPMPLGSISGRYFCDTDGDSLDAGDAEPAIANAQVFLFLAGVGLVARTETDADGNYIFEGIEAGSYQIRFEAPDFVDPSLAEKIFVDANAGDDAIDSDVVEVSGQGVGRTDFFDLAAGETITNVDAGIIVPVEDGAIAGTYFCDEDGDGVQDAGEGGLAGFTVALDGAGADGAFGTADDVQLTTMTDDTGSFSLADVEAGSYRGTIGNTVVGEFSVSAGATAEVTVGADCLEIPTDGLFLGDLEANAANKARFGFPNDGTVRGDWEYSAADGKLSGDILLDFVMLADGTMTTFTGDDAPVLLFDVNLDTNGDIASSDAQDLLVFDDADGDGQLDAGETVLLSAQAVASGISADGEDIDFIFKVTGGTMQDDFDALVAMQVSNDPTTFTSLEEDFTGRPKGFIGDLDYDCFCFVDDMAVA